MKIKKLKLSTRVAFVYSMIIFSACLTILIATNLFIRQSLNKQPIIKAISPNAISITINNEVNKSLSYYIPIESEEFMQALAHTNINSDTFNNILNSNIMQRVLTFSVLTSIIFGLLSIFAAIYYSKRITSPITNILKVTEDISLNNMNERINMPSKYDETSRIIALYNKALDKLQATFCDLELFNSYASHELRNSLAILSACLEQSADEAKTDRNDFSKIVKKALEYINRLSNTVIDIMSLSSRQLKDCNEPVDLALLAARAVDEYKLTGARIELNIPDEGVPYVAGKELWLFRAICNLLDNALKHSDKNLPVVIDISHKFNAVVISVKDNGSGIDSQSLEYIWQPYYSKPAPGKKGVGLGLAMVKQVVDSLGGFIWVESDKETGSTFYLSFPVTQVEI